MKTIKPKKRKRISLPKQTTFGDEVVNSFGDFLGRVEQGRGAEQITLRTVSLDLQIQDLSTEQIKAIRLSLNVSQSIMAKLLGVSVLTVQSWEQGSRKPSPMACRFLDEIAKYPAHWKKRLSGVIVAA